MTAAASPLAALTWVFAGSAIVLAALAVGTLCLAVRHRRRRRSGVYTRILAEAPSSSIWQVLTVGDLLVDSVLREQVQRKLATDAQRPQPKAPSPQAKEQPPP
jgi:hypothetical protein